jgi:hypothetical protein
MRRQLLINAGADSRLVKQFDVDALNALPADRFDILFDALTLTLSEHFTLKSVGCHYSSGNVAGGSMATVRR